MNPKTNSPVKKTALAAALLLLPLAAWAGGVVATCTEPALRAAMAGGGVVTFACDGTITLAATITNETDTVLDSSGHQVNIGGAGPVFYVLGNTSLTMIHLTISNGRTRNGADAVYNYPNPPAGSPGGPGGGIYNAGTLMLRDCVVAANRTGDGGLGYGSPFGCTTTRGGSGGPGGGIYNAGTATLSNCIVSANSTGIGGQGGRCNADLSYDVGGPGGFGAGIYNAGTLRLDNSTVKDNYTGYGINNPYRGSGADGGAGGGIRSGGNLTANGCTFTGNWTGSGGRGGPAPFPILPGPDGYGGAGGAICGAGPLALTNCTFAANFTGSGYVGGPGGSGVGIYSQGSLVMVNCTVSTNQAGRGGSGGGIAIASGTAQLRNTIVALNTGISADVSGAFLSLGHNLIGVTDGSSGFPTSGDLVGSSALPLNPKLGPLAYNGGPTLTMALLPGSPAIDAGDTAAAPPADQRGFPRPAGLAADIGAFESGWAMPSLTLTRSGATGLNILGSGIPGQSCRLLSSTDLSSWVPVATNQFGTGGTILFYDHFALGSAYRFYRLVMP